MLLINHYMQVLKHKLWVMLFILKFSAKLIWRGLVHDFSKFSPAEASIFAEATPRLKSLTYGSDEYKKELDNLDIALKHHYENNKHHPEYYGQPSSSISVIGSMTLLDITEMLCDWMAAVKRHNNGDINKSIQINKERFDYTNEMENILKYTVEEIK